MIKIQCVAQGSAGYVRGNVVDAEMIIIDGVRSFSVCHKNGGVLVNVPINDWRVVGPSNNPRGIVNKVNLQCMKHFSAGYSLGEIVEGEILFNGEAGCDYKIRCKHGDAFTEVSSGNCAIVLQAPTTQPEKREHSHYFKKCPYDEVDVYRVIDMFEVTDSCIQHALKKLLVAGGRGAGKDISRDIKEAIDTLKRWQEMRAEEKDASNA